MTVNVTVDPPLVRQLIDTELTDQQIEGLIATAIVQYDYYLGSYGLANDIQLEIKRYLAAHYVSLRDPSAGGGSGGVAEEKIGDASIKFKDKGSTSSKVGIFSSVWGQTAISLDPTGVLSSLGGQPFRVQAIL